MNFFQAFLLGAVQGLTEFLPVSSSGHLVILQEFLPGLSTPGIMLEVILHFGTTVAVLIYFWRDIISISIKYLLLIAIATIPAGMAGFLIEPFADLLFSSTTLVGFALLFTATFNWLTHRSEKKERAVSATSALIIGMMQAFAIIPGISRSGSTIFAGVKMGIEPTRAAKFSFLLSVPVIIGANLVEMYGNRGEFGILVPQYVVGFLAALVFGLIAIHFVIRLLEEKKFQVFAVYAAVLGLLLIIF